MHGSENFIHTPAPSSALAGWSTQTADVQAHVGNNCRALIGQVGTQVGILSFTQPASSVTQISLQLHS